MNQLQQIEAQLKQNQIELSDLVTQRDALDKEIERRKNTIASVRALLQGIQVGIQVSAQEAAEAKTQKEAQPE